MPGFNQLSSSTGSYLSTLEALQNSRKLLSCTLDLIDAPSEARGYEAHRFSNQLLIEMRAHGIDPTREKVREYINAGVQILTDAVGNWKFHNPNLQKECETALASTIGRFELFFFDKENNGNISLASLIDELTVLRNLFPNADVNALRSNLLPVTLYAPETFCRLERASRAMEAQPGENSLANLSFEIMQAFA